MQTIKFKLAFKNSWSKKIKKKEFMIFLFTFKEVDVFVICHLSSIQFAYHSLCHCVLGCLSRQPYAQILALVLNNEMTVYILSQF